MELMSNMSRMRVIRRAAGVKGAGHLRQQGIRASQPLPFGGEREEALLCSSLGAWPVLQQSWVLGAVHTHAAHICACIACI